MRGEGLRSTQLTVRRWKDEQQQASLAAFHFAQSVEQIQFMIWLHCKQLTLICPALGEGTFLWPSCMQRDEGSAHVQY